MIKPLLDLFAQDPVLLLPLAGLTAFYIRAALTDEADKARIRSGEHPEARLEAYAATMVWLWALAALAVAAWLISGRGLDALGFRAEGGWVALSGWALAAAGAAYMIYTVIAAALSRKTRIDLRRQFADGGDIDLVRPETPREHARFQWLSLTAGITEEIIFRGFLIGLFAAVLPLWAAAGIALALFLLGHAYQGPKGMVRLIPVSLALTVVFVLSGSLWPAIILHVFVDSGAGALMKLIQKTEEADAAAAQAA